MSFRLLAQYLLRLRIGRNEKRNSDQDHGTERARACGGDSVPGLGLMMVLFIVPLLGSCEWYFASNRDITSGVLCDVLGHQTANGSEQGAVAIGGVGLAAFWSSGISGTMYLVDELKAAEVLESSCDGHITTWRNTDTGQRYSVMPTRTYRRESARCRDFTTVMEVQGQEQTIHGSACRQPDGTWKALSA